jgi:hypothetical protein
MVGDERVLEPLTQAFMHSNREVRLAATASIQRIQQRMWKLEAQPQGVGVEAESD